MPEKGFRTTTLPNQLYDALEKRAKKNNRSIPGEIQEILNAVQRQEKGEVKVPA
jgi:hypothetical protein